MFETLLTNWWGILIICAFSLCVWVIISALFYRVFFKRFYDMVLSALALMFLSPVFLLLIVIGAINMKGNPFFTQLRPGKNGKIFKLIKFRTMTMEKDAEGNLLPDAKRLTKYGKALRATSLDELPELINIFIGSMSIVGPRPQLVRDMVFMSDAVKLRHKVRGGLTGLAQVNGRNNITWEEKFEYDLEYIKKITLLGDIKILFGTVIKVAKGSDVSRDGMETDIDYGDWLLNTGKVTKEEYNLRLAEAKELIGG